jgi:hypothetical protein
MPVTPTAATVPGTLAASASRIAAIAAARSASGDASAPVGTSVHGVGARP